VSRLADRLSGLDRPARTRQSLGRLPFRGGRRRVGRWNGFALLVILFGMLIGSAAILWMSGRGKVVETRSPATVPSRAAAIAGDEPSAEPAPERKELHRAVRETAAAPLRDRALGTSAEEPVASIIERAVALARAGTLGGAATLFRQALALEPRRADLWNDLGVILVRSGDLPAGIAAFREALALRPADPEAHRNLAVALERRGQAGAAIRHYQAFLDSAGPEHPDRAEVGRRLAAIGPRRVRP
jgi:tetratricopeptide (TPR) repeat protein